MQGAGHWNWTDLDWRQAASAVVQALPLWGDFAVLVCGALGLVMTAIAEGVVSADAGASGGRWASRGTEGPGALGDAEAGGVGTGEGFATALLAEAGVSDSTLARLTAASAVILFDAIGGFGARTEVEAIAGDAAAVGTHGSDTQVGAARVVVAFDAAAFSIERGLFGAVGSGRARVLAIETSFAVGADLEVRLVAVAVIEALHASALAVDGLGLEGSSLFLGAIEGVTVIAQEHADVLIVTLLELVAIEVVQTLDGHTQARRLLAGPRIVVFVAIGVVRARIDTSTCLAEIGVADLRIAAVLVVRA